MSGISIDHDAWVIVGDGEKALFLRNEGNAAHLNLELIEVLTHANPSTHDQGADRPGRTHSSLGARRSALDDTNWHQLEKHLFAVEIADALSTAAHQGLYSKLIIVAPPQTIGDLRKHMHIEVSDKVVGQIARTLTNRPARDIERALSPRSN
jgi:protein required for attachment to host cells